LRFKVATMQIGMTGRRGDGCFVASGRWNIDTTAPWRSRLRFQVRLRFGVADLAFYTAPELPGPQQRMNQPVFRETRQSSLQDY
jgi:hypothetical protein